MTYDEWFEEYKPIKNPLDSEGSFNGRMFETYGADWEAVGDWAERHVWTLIHDDGLHIIPGRRWINRLGYFITKQPWAEEDEWALSIEVE